VTQNADPSCKTAMNYGQLQQYAGFPVGCLGQTVQVDSSFRDQHFNAIRQWLGIIGGNASTSIIDTSSYGKVIVPVC
jgi:hypothetical protein